MRRTLAWAVFSLVGVVIGCSGHEPGSSGGGDIQSLSRAVDVAGAASLAYPEYDLDIAAPSAALGSRPAADIDAQIAAGFRLTSISAAGPFLFNAGFVENSGVYARSGNGWASGLSENDLMGIYADQNRRIVDIASSWFLGQRVYAAVWVANTGSQHFDYKMILHATPADFQAQVDTGNPADPHWRVIDVETQGAPPPGCNPFSCVLSNTVFEVSGIAIADNDPATRRQQYFGYGPVAGVPAPPATPPTPPALAPTLSVGMGLTFNHARMADLSSPFGDGNFYWVAEDSLDRSAPADPVTPKCTFNPGDPLPTPPSTERNWWFADLRIESPNDNPSQEDFVQHAAHRFVGRPGKIKSYTSTAMFSGVRYAGVLYDNGMPAPTGTDPAGNHVLEQIDIAFMNRLKRWGLPGGALALAKNGQLIFARGYGHADLGTSTSDGTPVDPEKVTQPTDMFRLASVSKPIAETLLLRLLNQDAGIHGGPTGITLQSHPFGDIFPYSGSPSAQCATDASQCSLADIRLVDLIHHTTGLVTSVDNPGIGDKCHLFDNDGQPTDGPGANTPAIWVNKENYYRCLPPPAGGDGCPPPPPPGGGVTICVRPPEFTASPGTREQYMNTEYQITLAVIEALANEPYANYLAEVLAPYNLNRILPAHVEQRPEAALAAQTFPYSLPMPSCYGGAIPDPSEADRTVDQGPASLTHGFLGSASIAASMVDLVRFFTAVENSRGGPIFGAIDPMTGKNPVFDQDFRSPGGAFLSSPYVFLHGGLFNHDAQAMLLLDGPSYNNFTYAFAVNGDSLVCGQDQDLCCPGTTNCVPKGSTATLTCAGGAKPEKVWRWTHSAPTDRTGLGVFDWEFYADLEAILQTCPGQLPTGDHFADYIPGEPRAVCKNITVPGGSDCKATVSPSQLDGGSINETNLSISPPGPVSGPSSTVQLLASNAHSTSTCTAVVTVADTTPPGITCPPPLTYECTNARQATVSAGAAIGSDSCGHVTVTDPPVQSYPVGPPTTVTHTATDGSGIPAQCTNTVTVVDTTPPSITCPANVTVQCTGNGRATNVNTGSATASDACGSVTVFDPAPATYLTGPPTTVTHKATDQAGLMNQCTHTVTVVDTTPPVLTVPPDITISSCGTPSIGTATAVDACNGTLTVTSDRPAKFPAGTTIVNYRAVDAAGNPATGTQRVTVTVTLGDDPSCCPGATNVIVGNSSNNTLNGTSGSDCILGLGGQDRINGLGGNDFISGGDGDDIIDGGDGNDQIWGGLGQDQITGGTGDDIINGGDGDDTCHAGDGNDVVHGNNGNDWLFGENGDDQLFGETGDDHLDGGPGNDTLNGGGLHDVCTGGTGTNTFITCATQM